METTPIIFSAIMPIFLIIAIGYSVRRIGWLNEEADKSLMTLVVNVLYPALIFSFILDNDALRQASNVIIPPVIGFSCVIIGFALSIIVAHRFKIGSPRDCRTFAFTTGLNNYGYFPIPIIALLFDRETTGVLLVHNVGVEIAMWSIGVGFMLSSQDRKPIWKRILSAPVLSIIIAVPLNLLGFGARLPDFAFKSIDLLGQCAIPLGLLLIGATFSDLSRGSNLFKQFKIPLVSCLLRVGLFPIGYLLIAVLLPISTELKQVMIVQGAMPCAVFPIVLAKHFNGSPNVAVQVVLSTTIVSFITIPLWIGIGLSLLP